MYPSEFQCHASSLIKVLHEVSILSRLDPKTTNRKTLDETISNLRNAYEEFKNDSDPPLRDREIPKEIKELVREIDELNAMNAGRLSRKESHAWGCPTAGR